MTQRHLLCCGDATDLATWSNIPYFLLQAGLKHGIFQSGLALQPQQLRHQRRFWNLRQLLFTGKAGGFQYSTAFTKALLAQEHLNPDQPLALLSHFPLLPCHPWPSAWRVDFYIDATTARCLMTTVATLGGLSPPGAGEERQAYHKPAQSSAWRNGLLIQSSTITDDRARCMWCRGANLDESKLARCRRHRQHRVLNSPWLPG